MQTEDMGKWAFVPAVAGLRAGILFLLLLDHTVPHLHMNSSGAERTCGRLCGSARAVSFELCGQSHGLCGGGGTDTGDVGRKTF